MPRELIDAASVDGARRWAILRHVILPQLWPVTIFLLVWQTLLALQLFDLVYATTRGGPIESTVVIVYYIYNQAFTLFHAGYAAAVAVVVARLPDRCMVGAQLALQPRSGSVPRMTRRLPFSPWHLLLAPIALLFALPLVWMVLSSFMSNAQINQFPPTIIPDSLHLDGCGQRARRLRLPALVPQLDDRLARSPSPPTSSSARSPATPSPGCGSAARPCSSC